jgi:transposase
MATKRGIHQTMLGEWKKHPMVGLTAVVADRSAAQGTAKSSEVAVEKLHSKIGQLLVEWEPAAGRGHRIAAVAGSCAAGHRMASRPWWGSFGRRG